MAALTLTEARDLCAHHLDDPNHRRWLNSDIDFALQASLTRCLTDYAGAGGTQFDIEFAGSSSAVDGTLSMSSLSPLMVRSVQILSGNRFSPIRPSNMIDRLAADLTSRNVRAMYVRDYVIPTTAGNPLVGVAAVAAPTWPAFDHWIIAEAALQLGVRDNDQRPGLEALAARSRQAVMDRVNTPQARPLPLPRDELLWAYDLGWGWSPSTSTISLFRIPAIGALW